MAIVDVVKYNGNPDVFAWKYPNEELGTWTQLIVNESQEAILYKGGRALDVFTSGRHTLETANIPLLKHIVNLPFGGHSPFTAEVWYVNKVNSLDIKWGTSSPIQLQDPKYSVFIPVRAFGQFGIRVSDSRKFLEKLVGTLPIFDKAALLRYFRGLYLTMVKDSVSSYLVRKQISIMEINAYIHELSVYLQEKMQPVMEDYGICLLNFYVTDISVPEDDPAVQKLKNALAKRAEMNIIGYSYQQERSFDTLDGAARNAGTSGAIMGAGIGVGMGLGIGGSVGAQFNGMANVLNANTDVSARCPACGAAVSAGKRFCADCGHDLSGKNSPAKADTAKCRSCGNTFSSGMKFCPHCGKKYIPCENCGADLPENCSICPECGTIQPAPCPHCGILIADKDARFCPHCGTALTKICPGCGAQLSGSPAFCPSCGRKRE